MKLIERLRNDNALIALFFIFVGALSLRFYVDSYHIVMAPDYDGFQYIKIARGIKNFFLPKEAINWTPLFPFFMAIFSFLPFPIDQVGSYVNIFFGAITIFPIYLLVKRIVSKEAAMMAVVIYAFDFSIAFVNVQVMSETLFIFTIFMYGLFSYKAIEEEFSFKNIFLCGFTGALAYYARPEGLALFLSLLLLTTFASKRFTLNQKVVWFLAVFALFLLLISPYLFFFKKQLGYFTFSGKSKEALPHLRKLIGIPEMPLSFIETVTYDYQATLKLIGKNLLNAIYLLTEGSVFKGCFLVFSFVMFVLAIAKGKRVFIQNFLFFLCLVTPFSGTLLFLIDPRYFSPTMAVITVIIGIGLSRAIQFIPLRLLLFKRLAYISLCMIFVFLGFYRVYEVFEKNGEFKEMVYQANLYKTPGEWLKLNAPKDAKVISSSSTNYLVAYYADLEFIGIGQMTPAELFRLMGRENNAYLYINELAVRKSFQSMYFLLNPNSFAFKKSVFYGRLAPVYVDLNTGVVLYRYVN